MLPFLKLREVVLLPSLMWLATAIAGYAQESNVGSPPDGSFGLDTPSFERVFGEALRRVPPPPPPTTSASTLADNVIELRLFLTDAPEIVRGEIATSGSSGLEALPVVMEQETVIFRDDGEGPDTVKDDGIFTALFKFDTTGTFQARRSDLQATIDILQNQRQNVLIRRGPRDIVVASDAIQDAELKMKEPLSRAREQVGLASRLLDFEGPLEAAQAIGINTNTIPFLLLPGPRFNEAGHQQFKVDHVFNFPIFTIFPPLSASIAIDQERSLMIRETSVVEDGVRSFDACSGTGTAGGVWSFGHLMRELAQGTGLTPEEFTRSWLSTWQLPQEANGWMVNEPTRSLELQSLVINSWRQLSPGHVFNVDYFPARLLAIVNRPDLADRIGYGAAGGAGEGRLVFGLIINPSSGVCTAVNFTVIFEYRIAASSCAAVKAWQQRWKDLDQFAVDSPDYAQALESITRAFTDHGSNPGQIPNTSSLAQLRTNETLLDFPWQLREFRLQENGLLDLVTVKQTPDNQFDNHATLRVYLGINETKILLDRHIVPERFPDILDPFIGAVSEIEPSSSFFWSAPNLSSLVDPIETRRKFSLATCNGCHSGETETTFTHIGTLGTRDIGTPASLSGFLLGETVAVPLNGGTHRYEDLTERKIAMSNLLNRSCFELLGFQRLPFVH